MDTDLDEAALRQVVDRFKGVVKAATRKPFPQDPHEQLRMARNAVFRSWNNPRAREYRRIYDIPDSIGTAVNVQMMVFGNTGDRSATGVGFTRNPATGAKEFYGEFLVNAQGEDVVAGIRTPQPIRELEAVMPKAYAQLRADHHAAREALQGHPGLRVHHPGRPAVHAADAQRQAHRLRRRGDRHRHGEGTAGHRRRRRCCSSIPRRCRSCSRPASIPRNGRASRPPPAACRRRPAPPRGQAVFTADDAVAWSQQGKPVILVRRETVPDDIHGMWVAQGILTATGGMTSHAAVVGRQMGKPSIVGAGELAIDEHGRRFTVKGQTVKEGDWIAFDGLTGEVKLAKVAAAPSEILQVIDGQDQPAKDSEIYRRFDTLLARPTRCGGWACAPTPISRTRPRSPTSSAPGASACAAPSTCSSARAGSRSCSG